MYVLLHLRRYPISSVTVAEDTTLLLLAAGGGDNGAIDRIATEISNAAEAGACRFDSAEQHLRAAYDMRRSLYDDVHPLVRESEEHIEQSLVQQGDADRLAAFKTVRVR
ncbi:MAG TPA: hypothetical protein VIL33_03920 [Rhodothermia bacterium]